jgi:hypothetical protein
MAKKRKLSPLARAEYERLLDDIVRTLFRVRGGMAAAHEMTGLLYDLLDAAERETMENELRTAFSLMELQEQTGVRVDA